MSEKKIIAPFTLPDYRVARPTMFLEENGNTVMSVQQLSSFKMGKCKISFVTPNSVTMFYNKSWKEYKAAVIIHKRLIRPHLNYEKGYAVPFEELSELYDYFEHIQTSIITIYSALEALCNVAIPLDYELKRKNNKGVIEVWDKSNIERWFTTDEKLDLISEILKIESPKKLGLWKHYVI